MLTKMSLLFFGIIVIIMGFLSVVPQLAMAAMPLWYGILLIVIGLIAAIVGLMAKRPGK